MTQDLRSNNNIGNESYWGIFYLNNADFSQNSLELREIKKVLLLFK